MIWAFYDIFLCRRYLTAKKNTKPSLEKESDEQSIPLFSDKTLQPPRSLRTPIQETDTNTDTDTSLFYLKCYAPLRWYSGYTPGADLSGTDIDVYDRVQVIRIERPANDPIYDHLLQPRKAGASDYSNMLLTELSHHRRYVPWGYSDKLLADTVIPTSRKAGILCYSDNLLTDTVTPSSRIADRRYYTI